MRIYSSRKYVKCGQKMDDYILSKDYISEIQMDARRLVMKLDRLQDSTSSKYGEGTASYISDAINSIESSVNRIVSQLRQKGVKAACGKKSNKKDVDSALKPSSNPSVVDKINALIGKSFKSLDDAMEALESIDDSVNILTSEAGNLEFEFYDDDYITAIANIQISNDGSIKILDINS